jgi:beta-glucosidase
MRAEVLRVGALLLQFSCCLALSFRLPLFKQCDSRWADELMGVNGSGHRTTICHEGCAMSCVAMVLNGLGFVVPGTGATVDPGSLNAYLKLSHGYRCAAGDCDNLVLNAPDAVTGGRMRYVGEWPAAALPMTALPGLDTQERIYLAHVRSPRTGRVSHFVVLLSYDEARDAFNVLDPGYDQTSYARTNVSDLLMYELLPSAASVPQPYPLFKQCDPSWASDRIDVKTVCQVGCLMSSTSMALSERGIGIPLASAASTSHPPPSSASSSSSSLVDVASTAPMAARRNATPGTLNAWLRENGGYVPGTDDLDEAVVARLDPSRIAWTNASMHTTNDIPWEGLVRLLNAGAAVIANVDDGHHFVLVVGYDAAVGGDALYVNDPGFARASYSYKDDVVGWRLYAMARGVGARARAAFGDAADDGAVLAAEIGRGERRAATQLENEMAAQIDAIRRAAAPAATPAPAVPKQSRDPFPFRDPTLPWDERVDDLVSRRSLEEKIAQMSHGGAGGKNDPTPPITRLGVQPYQWGTECISGDVFAGPATSFPMSMSMASSFDADLLRRTANATGWEVRAKNNDAARRGIHMFHTGLSCWSPVINIARHPLWGRNQETYGEDPLLNGVLGAAFVRGLQGNASSRYLLANAGCKHFAGFAGPLNSNGDHSISERDWQTTYLPQFKMCVDAGAWSLMCSYSSVNGEPSCGSKLLLTDILRTQWKFPGYVVSDQTALEQIAGTYSPNFPGDIPAGYAPFNRSAPLAAALIAKAGCDLEDTNWNSSQPAGHPGFSGNVFSHLPQAVAAGLLDPSTIDVSVKRLFAVRFRLGEFDPPEMTRVYTGIPLAVVQSAAHRDLALEASRKTMVLLKNLARKGGRGGGGGGGGGGRALPLSAAALRGRKLALVGPFADGLVVGPIEQGKCGRGAMYYGDYAAGPFQSYWKLGPGPWPEAPTARNLTVTLADALEARAKEIGASLSVARGCTTDCNGGRGGGVCNRSSYEKAAVARAVRGAAVAIVALGTGSLTEAEGIDRPSLELPGAQDEILADTVAAVGADGLVIVVVFNAGGVNVSWAAGSAEVDAILSAGFPGQAAGAAVVDTLFGAAVPAGRLTVTWPRSLESVVNMSDYSMSGSTPSTYRYGQKDPLFPFGYGLSYTEFAYSNVSVTPHTPAPCEAVTVRVSVTNTGAVDSDEVVMAFVEWDETPPPGYPTPELTLAAFARVHIPAGQTMEVSLELQPSSLAVLAVPGIGKETSTWMVGASTITAHVGGQLPAKACGPRCPRAPSNVLEAPFSVAGATVPLSKCR